MVRTKIDHSKSGLVWISDPHCTGLILGRFIVEASSIQMVSRSPLNGPAFR